jgi:hypothetical protein
VHVDGTISGSGAIAFTNIYFNVGSTAPWQAGTSRVVIPTQGTYYVEIVGQTYPGPMDMRLTLNGAVISRILFSYSSVNYVTRSRSIITYLRANDQLQVVCSYSYLTGDSRGGISFMGALLYQN